MVKKSFFLPAMLNGFLSEANSMAKTHTWTKLRMNKKCHWTRDNTPQFNYRGRTYSDGLLMCGKKIGVIKIILSRKARHYQSALFWTGAAIEKCLRKKFWGSNCVCSWICEGGVRYTRCNTDFSSLDSHLDFNRASAFFKLLIGKSWYKQTRPAQISPIHPPPSFSHYQATTRTITNQLFEKEGMQIPYYS